MCDEKGGVDLDRFAQYLGVSVLWVAYLFEYELNEEYNDFINSTKNGDLQFKDFDKLLKAVLIDFKNKIIYIHTACPAICAGQSTRDVSIVLCGPKEGP